MADVIENMKRAANRYQAEKVKEDKEDISENEYLKGKSFDDTRAYANNGYGEKASPFLKPKGGLSQEETKLLSNFTLDEDKSNKHWGAIKDEESPHSSYRKIKKLNENTEPIFRIQKDLDAEDKNDLPVDMTSIREITRIQPVNKEVTSANWINAVLLKPFDKADDKAKGQFSKYLTEMPFQFLYSTGGLEENLDQIYQRNQQRERERKDPAFRNPIPGSNQLRPHSTSFCIPGEEQKEGHGEISYLKTRVTMSKILVRVLI